MQDWTSVLERDAVGILSLNKFRLSIEPSFRLSFGAHLLLRSPWRRCETPPSSSCSLFSSIACSPTVRSESVVVSHSETSIICFDTVRSPADRGVPAVIQSNSPHTPSKLSEFRRFEQECLLRPGFKLCCFIVQKE